MPALAVLILTYNEEENIADCINSARFADEIIVIDSLSTDNTVGIAQQMGAKVVSRAMSEGFASQRNFAISQTQADWVLYLDADERLTPGLVQEIAEIVKKNQRMAYEILRKNIVFGKPVYHGGNAPDWSRRLYPRDAIRWEGCVHECAIVNVPMQRCREAMIHYTYTSWEKYLRKFNQYTTLMAEKNFANGKRAGWQDLIFRPIIGFIKMYLFKRGFLDGKIGLILAVLHAFYTFVKYIKLDYLAQIKHIEGSSDE
jgi:glycosyltransferase involved in cell wall biosynthesis